MVLSPDIHNHHTSSVNMTQGKTPFPSGNNLEGEQKAEDLSPRAPGLPTAPNVTQRFDSAPAGLSRRPSVTFDPLASPALQRQYQQSNTRGRRSTLASRPSCSQSNFGEGTKRTSHDGQSGRRAWRISSDSKGNLLYEGGGEMTQPLHDDPKEMEGEEGEGDNMRSQAFGLGRGTLFEEPEETQPMSPSAHGDLDVENLGIDNLVAVTTKVEYERYNRGYTRPMGALTDYLIDPLRTSFDVPPIPEGWTTFVHPEGTRYFYHPSHPVPVVTEAWIYDQEIFDRLQSYMNQIFAFIRDKQVIFPSAPPRPSNSKPGVGDGQNLLPQEVAPIVLVLEFRLSGRIGYYFVSHPTQTLFWPEEFNFTWLLGEVRVDHTDWMVGMQMKNHYWYHNELFPHLYELTDDDIHQVEDHLSFSLGDVYTSESNSTTKFSREILAHMLSTVCTHDQKDFHRRRKSVGERVVIIRMICDYANERFLNLHGERGARLNATQSIHYSAARRKKPITSFITPNAEPQPWHKMALSFLPAFLRPKEEDPPEFEEADPPIDDSSRELHTPSYFMKYCSLVMFGGPGLHLKRLKDVAVDAVVGRIELNKFTEKMVEEWRDVVLWATVILSADVSFLTIQSVDTTGVDGIKSNWQRASYFSILASMGTIVFGLALLRQHRETIDVTFIANRSLSRWGLESLALMYGLPFSLLIWSMISFFMSFALLWYATHDYVVITTVSASGLAFTVILVWAIMTAFEEGEFKTYKAIATDKAKTVKKVVRRATRRMSGVMSIGPLGQRKNSMTMLDQAESGCIVSSPLEKSPMSSPTQTEGTNGLGGRAWWGKFEWPSSKPGHSRGHSSESTNSTEKL